MMKKQSKFSIATILIVLLSSIMSCQKSKNAEPEIEILEIRAKVVDINTHIPIPDLYILLTERHPKEPDWTEPWPFESTQVILAETYTDQEGWFSFTHEWTEDILTLVVNDTADQNEDYIWDFILLSNTDAIESDVENNGTIVLSTQ